MTPSLHPASAGVKLARHLPRRYNVQRMATSRITWHDLLVAPDDGQRYEAIGGNLYVTPAPSIRHQVISGNLFEALRRLLYHPGHGLVLAAPLGVEFPDSEEGVQPDIVFVRKRRLAIVGADWIRGAPDLVVEILSPTTAVRDRKLKRDLYERQGVAQYWLVDPDAQAVEVWDFAAGKTHPELHTDDLPVCLGESSFGTIALSEVFPRES